MMQTATIQRVLLSLLAVLSKSAFAISLALVSQSAFGQTVVERDFGGIANEYASVPPDPTQTGFKMTVVPAGSTELLFYRTELDSAEPAYSRWTNLELDSDIGRVDTTFALVPPEFDPYYPPGSTPRLTLSTLTLKDMDLDPQDIQFSFYGANTALVLNNSSVDLLRSPIFRTDSQLSLRSEGTGISTISQLTGDQGSSTAIDVASGTTLRFFGSGRLTPGLPDSQRSNFNQPDNSAVINGTLDIDTSYVIFNTGPNEAMLVNSGGQLKLQGSETVLETGDLRVDGGTVDLGIGGARLETKQLALTDAMVNVGAASALESTGATGVSGMNTISGNGTLSTPVVAFGGSGGEINITDSARLQVTAGAPPQTWENGSIDIGAIASMDIESGARVLSSHIPINNEGSLLVSGQFEPVGTMTGDGFMRIEADGVLGPFGSDSTDTFMTSTDILMEGLSALEVLINPMALSSQRLIANGEFTLESQTGVYLDLLTLPNEDELLAYGTKFAIVDYLDGNDLMGHFIRDDLSIINEGGLITEGLNTFRLSYSDPDYSPGTSSVITLTAIPEPSTGILVAIGLMGGILVRRNLRI